MVPDFEYKKMTSSLSKVSAEIKGSGRSPSSNARANFSDTSKPAVDEIPKMGIWWRRASSAEVSVRIIVSMASPIRYDTQVKGRQDSRRRKREGNRGMLINAMRNFAIATKRHGWSGLGSN